MRVEVSMTTGQEFYVSSWRASSPESVIESLGRQLEAAAAVWPELAKYKINQHKGTRGGKMGGIARANSLTPERRSEIASKAAGARWHVLEVRDGNDD